MSRSCGITMADSAVVGGAYRLRFDDDARVYRMMARRADRRSLAGAYTGDQGIVVRRAITSTRRHTAQGPYRLIGRVMLIRLLYLRRTA